MTTFYPAVTGRSTVQMGISSLMFQIHHDQKAIQELQTQLSTGRRVQMPSQDPSAAIRALTAQRQLDFKSQTADNLKSADSVLSATESTLSQAQDILNQMRGIAVQSAGSTLLAGEVDAFVSQIGTAITKLADLGNSKFRDQYIFSGSNVLQSPFEFVGDTVHFAGNSEELRTVADSAIAIASNISANDAFGVRSNRVMSTVDLNPALQSNTPLAHLNRGDGVRGGSISFGNGVNSVQIDLSKAYNVSDVVEGIEAINLGGRDLAVTVSATGLQVQYADGLGGTLRIEDVGNGAMASDLGINNEGTIGTSPVISNDLNPIATGSTRLADLFGGTGIPSGESFRIQQGNKSYAISTVNVTTIEDLINKIHRSGAKVEAELDASGRFLSVRSIESGTTMSISENGSTLAARLGIRTMDATTRIQDLNFGQGVETNPLGDDLVITRSNGSEMRVDLAGVQSLGDVIDRINNHVGNFTPSLRVVASLNTVGNGLMLTAPAGGQAIRIKNAGGSQAAWGLGMVAAGKSEAVGQLVGTSSVIRGIDVSGVEVEGTFTSLIRLRQAIENGDAGEMERLAAALDRDMQRLSLSRGIVGARQQSIQQMQDLTAEQTIQLKEIESNELDADLAEVISQLTAREAALQASLKAMGQQTRLTLFDYL